MQVEFADSRLKRLCEDRAARQRQWQKAAAASLEVLRTLPGKWQELTGDRKGQLSCRLDKKLRLVIRPTKQPPPAKPDGGLDWRAVDAVTVLDVESYHD